MWIMKRHTTHKTKHKCRRTLTKKTKKPILRKDASILKTNFIDILGITKNSKSKKNGYNAKSVRLSLYKATRTFYSSFNVPAKNISNRRRKRN